MSYSVLFGFFCFLRETKNPTVDFLNEAFRASRCASVRSRSPPQTRHYPETRILPPSRRHAQPVPSLALRRIKRLIGPVQQFLDVAFAIEHRKADADRRRRQLLLDRKSTRLNSSH